MRRVFNTIPVVSDVWFKTFFILLFLSLVKIDSPFNSVLPTYFSIKSQLDIFGLISLNLISTKPPPLTLAIYQGLVKLDCPSLNPDYSRVILPNDDIMSKFNNISKDPCTTRPPKSDPPRPHNKWDSNNKNKKRKSHDKF